MIRHVASIAEIVDDFDAAVRFYRDALGLTVEPKPDGNYAEVSVDGVPHFGIWRRAHAALIIHGDATATDKVPLGFTVGFEVDRVEEGEGRLRQAGAGVVQANHLEPWGQRTARFVVPSGGVCEIAETPWARRLQASARGGSAE
jgi:catechol 2,3-dioxygenase-like lactoylglutathione lyase family enzyme